MCVSIQQVYMGTNVSNYIGTFDWNLFDVCKLSDNCVCYCQLLSLTCIYYTDKPQKKNILK